MFRSLSKTTLFQRFRSSETGSILMMTAFSLPVVIVAAGSAIEYSRAVAERSAAQGVLDQTLLALSANGTTTGQLQTEGSNVFTSVLNQRSSAVHIGDTQFSGTGDADARPSSIAGQASLTINTGFLGLIGVNEIGFTVSSTVQPPRQRPVEVALVLDVSGSMGTPFGSGTRLSSLKSAVTEMFEVFDERIRPHAPLSVSVVPYSSSVNITSVNSNAIEVQSFAGNAAPPVGESIWAAEYVGAVGADAAGNPTFNLSDVSPLTAPIPFYSETDVFLRTNGTVQPGRHSPEPELLALTGDEAAYQAAIDGLTANGFTAAHLGMIWGVYALSPNWSSTWPQAPQPYGESEKIIVMLTDGAFNTTVNTGDGSTSDGGTVNAYYQAACDLAINQGVTVYTIALSLDAAGSQRLSDCTVGGGGRMISANSASELTQAFQEIALLIGSLRVSG